MYKVKVDEKLLCFTGSVNGMEYVTDPDVKLVVNGVDSFSFAIYPQHPLYKKIVCKVSRVKIWRDSKLLFYGEVTGYSQDMYGIRTYDCEGALAWLNDLHFAYSISGATPKDVLYWYIKMYNQKLRDKSKSFELGTVTVHKAMTQDGTEGTIARSSGVYPSFWEEIQDKLLNSFGGILRVRYVGSDSCAGYIDWLAIPDGTCTQDVRYAKNLLNCDWTYDCTSIATAVVPLGKRKDSSGDNEVRLTIDKADDDDATFMIQYMTGTDDLVKYGNMVYSKSRMEKYGLIQQAVTFDDVTDTGTLAYQGAVWLRQNGKASSTISAEAIDLADIDESVEHFTLGDYVRTKLPGDSAESLFPITAIEIPIAAPESAKLTVGTQESGITSGSGGQGGGSIADAGSGADAMAHTHSNKGVLDKITEQDYADFKGAVNKAHTHSNKGVLDKIEQPYTTAERDKLAGLENYTHPEYTEHSSGLYGITIDHLGHVTFAYEVGKSTFINMGLMGSEFSPKIKSTDNNHFDCPILLWDGKEDCGGSIEVLNLHISNTKSSTDVFSDVTLEIGNVNNAQKVRSSILFRSGVYSSVELCSPITSEERHHTSVYLPFDTGTLALEKNIPKKTSELENDAGYGTYTKPATGIPKSDLASGVQASLGKADTALQKHQDISGKQDKSTAVTHTANTAVGSVAKPVYIAGDGKATPITHSINSDVPSNAKFTDTTYSDATQSTHGLMTAADKKKLDGIAAGATKVAVDSALSATSTNPVQNKAVKAALDSKSASGHTHAMITNSALWVSGANNTAKWVKLGTLVSSGNFSNAMIRVWSGDGANGRANQNSSFEVQIKDGWQSTESATKACGVTVYRVDCSSVKVKVIPTAHDTYTVWAYLPWGYWNGNYAVYGKYKSWTSQQLIQSEEPEGTGANTAYYDQAFLTSTVANATTWNGLINDVDTYNSSDTGILVKKDNRIQHRYAGELDVNSAKTLVDSGWKKPTFASGVKSSSIRYRKQGKIVSVTGYVQFSAEQTTITVFTLPTGYRPPAKIQQFNAVDSSAQASFLTKIDTDGKVGFFGKTRGFFTTATEYYMHCTFFVD